MQRNSVEFCSLFWQHFMEFYWSFWDVFGQKLCDEFHKGKLNNFVKFICKLHVCYVECNVFKKKLFFIFFCSFPAKNPLNTICIVFHNTVLTSNVSHWQCLSHCYLKFHSHSFVLLKLKPIFPLNVIVHWL